MAAWSLYLRPGSLKKQCVTGSHLVIVFLRRVTDPFAYDLAPDFNVKSQKSRLMNILNNRIRAVVVETRCYGDSERSPSDVVPASVLQYVVRKQHSGAKRSLWPNKAGSNGHLGHSLGFILRLHIGTHLWTSSRSAVGARPLGERIPGPPAGPHPPRWALASPWGTWGQLEGKIRQNQQHLKYLGLP